MITKPALSPTKQHFSGSADDEFVNFLSDDEFEPEISHVEPWKILITDDDQTVHDSTVLALNGVLIEQRPLHFLHAFSAIEAREVLLANEDISLVLLDVVMETMDAGFRLVDVIRGELKRADLRIVIRSGQPGDINTSHEHYRTFIDSFTVKSKITRAALIEVIEGMLAPRPIQ